MSRTQPTAQSLAEVLRQKDALYRLTDRLQRATSFEEMFVAALDAIVGALPCDRASILLCDQERVMRFVAWRGLSEIYRKAVEGHSPWHPDERNPMPVCIADIERADLSQVLKEVIRCEGIAAAGFIPLIGSAGLIGKFMVYSNTPHAFSAEEVELSLTIARQLALGIERRRADDALRAELADTRLLQRISAELIDQSSVSALYEKIIDAAMAIMRSDFASMQMLYPERGAGGELQLLSFRGFTPEAAKIWEWIRLDSETSCGEALRIGARVIAPDVLQHDSIAGKDLATFVQTGIRAVQTTPLFARSGALVGMISTHWKAPHVPSDRDLRLFDILARQAADLIERHRASEELSAVKDRLAEEVRDLKRTEQALAESEAKLREDDRRKDEFLAMLAHELRNPLAPIVNAVHLLSHSTVEDPVQQHARGVIERQVGRLARLVDDLLEVSRITSGRIQLHREHIALAGVVERAVETVRPLIEERRHVLSVSIPDDPIWLYADATRLEQVLVNLLNNATKYTDNGGSIELAVHTSEKHAVVRVRDNGVGIERELLPRIFELFTQAERSLDRSSGGLGIGLSLVQKLVEMHGGTVSVESEVDRGSEFTARLPLAEPTSLSSSDHHLPVTRSTGQSLRALVVDDNVDAAQSFGMLLESAGHHVRVAYEGEAALAAADGHKPHVIFLDIGLPKLDGYEIARRLRQHPVHRNSRLVAMTGYGQSHDRERAHAAGFDHHLVKPVNFSGIEQLLASIREQQA